MAGSRLLALIAPGRPSYEWHDVSYLRHPRASRGATISLFIVLWIAVADLCWPNTNLAILYIAPLILLARSANETPIWRAAGLLVLLTYAVYFLKNTVNPSDPTASYFNYRLINRSLVAFALLIMSQILHLWINSRAEQEDAELADNLRYEEQQTSSLFAIICCGALVSLIALVDFLAPANFNLAILYPIPLFICGWTCSRRLLWGMLLLLLSLTACAFWFGPPPTSFQLGFSPERNRILAAIGLVCVTVVLTYWMNRKDSICV